jgi:hypothetical protein
MAQEAHAMADLLLMYRSVGLEANRWKERDSHSFAAFMVLCLLLAMLLMLADPGHSGYA